MAQFGVRLLALSLVSFLCLNLREVRCEHPPANQPAGPTVQDELALKQGQMADKYARLEELMLKLSSLEASENPRRAALLQRAVQQSKEKLTKTQLETVVKLLQQNQMQRALDGQAAVHTDLKSLLDLLMSEDRGERLKGEKERIKEYIKEVERLIRLEKSLQGQTEGNGDEKRLAQEQQNIAGRTGDLVKKIKEQEEGKSGEGDESPEKEPSEGEPMDGKPSDGKPSDVKPSDGKPSDGKPSDGKPSDGKPSEGEPSEKEPMDGKPGEDKPSEDKPGDDKKPGEDKPMDGKPSDGKPSEGKPSEGKPSEGKPSEGKPFEGKPSEGKPSEGEPSDGQPSDSSPSGEQPDQDNPARKQLEKAQQAMKDAQQKLEQAKRKESLEDQQKAREELEKAKAELEEILRQLREEELERTLAQLEGRFRKMLEMQLRVYESTRRLDQIATDQRGDDFIVQAGKFSFDEQRISLEAQKALTLLLEEGSSVAFPASVQQMKEDIDQVSRRLGEIKIDELTIGIEEDVIAALEEIIEALQQAQQDLEEKKQQQQQQQQQMQEQEQPLVDQIAELKMIRALQERVNKRTGRYARLLEDDQDPIGQAEGADLIDALKELSGRQQEIKRITRDIVVGKNK